MSSSSPFSHVRTFSDYLAVGAVLACVAGVVNAVGFVAFGGFVTHVSGNATRAAVEYSEGHILVATTFLFATLFFMAGATFTTLLMRGHSIEHRKTTFAWVILIEALLIGVVGWFGAQQLSSGETLIISRAADTWFVNTLTFSMGMQNAILRQTSGIIIRTTHMTGIVTDIGIALGKVLSNLATETSKNPKGIVSIPPGSSFWEEAHSRLGSLFKRFHLERFFLHLSLLLSFLTGAVLGTFGYLRVGFRVRRAPLFVLIVLAALELVNWRKRIRPDGHELQSPS